jgi:hypothetical protein
MPSFPLAPTPATSALACPPSNSVARILPSYLGVESSERLGKHRWVVERTLAWRNRFRRLTVRYERRADLHQAFLSLGCALICWRFLTR